MSNTPMTPDQDPNVQLDVKKEETKKSIDWSGGWWSDLKNIYDGFPSSLGGPEYGPGPFGGGIYGGFGPIGSPVPDQKVIAKEKAEEKRLKVIAKENEWQPPKTQEEETERIDKRVADFANAQVAESGIDTAWRKISGIAPGATEQDLTTLMIIIPSTQDGKKRYNGNVYRELYRESRPGRGPKQTLYRGLGLTDENNMLARRQYDSRSSGGTDVRNELMLLGTTQGATLSLLKELKRTGFYPENTPISNMALNNSGFGAQDEAAVERFLDFSNDSLKTWQAMMPTLLGMTSINVGGGVKYRGPSNDEVAAFLQEASLTLTGDKLTKETLKKAIMQVQASSKASFYSGTQATSTSVLAEQQIQKSNPNQAASYGLGNAMQLAFRALGGQGG